MDRTGEQLRVLVAAEHASLQFGGEAALPLHYFRVMRARGMEAWLVVHERTRDELEATFPDDQDRITYIRDSFLHRFLWQCGRPLPARLRFFTFGMLMRWLTQRSQKRIVRDLIKEHGIDLVHQPIPVSPKEPSMLHSLGVPVLIGPMNGGINYPPAFKHMQGGFVNAAMNLGRMSANFLNTIIPGKRRAQVLLVANPRTRDALPDRVQGKVIELVENGVDLSIWSQDNAENEKAIESDSQSQDDRPTRFVYIGRLVDWKAVDLLLEAFAKVVQDVPDCELEIIGDGPDRSTLTGQAKRLNLLEKPNVIFAGWMSQKEAAAHLRNADALVLPSLMECGGAVVLEAMATSKPAIATNWGGPVDYLNDECGILVDPTSKEAFIQGLTDAMLKLAGSRELCEQMGQAGRRRIEEHFDWEAKMNRMLEIYTDAVADYRK